MRALLRPSVSLAGAALRFQPWTQVCPERSMRFPVGQGEHAGSALSSARTRRSFYLHCGDTWLRMGSRASRSARTTGGFGGNRFHSWSQFVGSSIRETAGKLHVLPNLAGSSPKESITDIFELPTIFVPHSYCGYSQHAPSEDVLNPVCRDALRVMVGIFWHIGDKPTRAG